jgi:deoxyribodipyrimidine photo-lyase
VAGLQTPGKTYLPRRSNLEKYCDPEWLRDTTGLDQLDNAIRPEVACETASLEIQGMPKFPSAPVLQSGRVGLWLHQDDCSAEVGAFSGLRPIAIAAFRSAASDESSDLSPLRRSHLLSALKDSCDRAAKHFQCEITFLDGVPLADSLADWAESKNLTEVLAYAPFVGPLGDEMGAIREALMARKITLSLFRRPWDADLFPAAKSGFFPFWATVESRLRNNAKSNLQLPLL